MTNANSVPIAVKTGPNSYQIAYQLAEPEIGGWTTVSPESRFTLEVSSLGQDNWTYLGSVAAGETFGVPNTFGPVPLFRTELDGIYLYIGIRKIDLEGTSNFRDIGGYRSEDSSQIRFGKIFRSDNLTKLTNADWKVIEQLDIGYVIDLRQTDEKARSRTAVPKSSNLEIIEIPIDVDILGRNELLQHIFSREITRITHDDMAQMYSDILAKFRSELTQVVSLLLDPSRRNKVVHCTAGKDRTGLSVALIQLLCKIPRPQIVSDFLLSNSFRTPARIAALSARLQSHRVDIEDIVPYLSASKPALLRAFEILENQYDGAENYVTFDETSSWEPADTWKSNLLYH